MPPAPALAGADGGVVASWTAADARNPAGPLVLSMCVYMYISMCIFVCTYVCVYIYTYTYTQHIHNSEDFIYQVMQHLYHQTYLKGVKYPIAGYLAKAILQVPKIGNFI